MRCMDVNKNGDPTVKLNKKSQIRETKTKKKGRSRKKKGRDKVKQ